MNKMLFFTLLLALCLAVLCGCSSYREIELPEEEPTPYYRVEYVGNGEFIASGNGYDILVKYSQASIFAQYDTAVIEFDEADLREERGTRSVSKDYEVTYAHVLENPNSVRRAGPGEPTFA